MRQAIEQAVVPLIGLALTRLCCAGNMRILHFGPLRKSKGQVVGAYALHIQCPWRLEASGKILTGFHDHYEPAIGNSSLQQQILEQSFQSAKLRNVLSARGDNYGGLVLRFTGGLRLRIFPAAATGEHWRLFQPHRPAKHFVVEAHLCYRE